MRECESLKQTSGEWPVGRLRRHHGAADRLTGGPTQRQPLGGRQIGDRGLHLHGSLAQLGQTRCC